MADAVVDDWRTVRSLIPDRCTLEVLAALQRSMAGARSAIFARQRQRYSALNLGYCDANPMRGAREGWIFPRVGHHGDSGVTDLRRFCRSVSHPALRAKGIVGEGLTLVAGTLIELTNGNFAAE